MLPELTAEGFLPPGLHAASLAEVENRFGSGSPVRKRQFDLLREVVFAARNYSTIKRILIWGSFASAKPEPNDLDYSVIVSIEHERVMVAKDHKRFFNPVDALMYYGVDRGYLVIRDYPLDRYAELVDFLLGSRQGGQRGIIEINIRGEYSEVLP